MAKTTTALATPLREQLDRLAAFEAVDALVLSLYLDMRADQQGRAQYDPFLRKVLTERGRTLDAKARRSFEHDAERITQYVGNVAKSVHGLAIFACSASDDFFEPIELRVPVEHSLFIGAVPHVYPLARLNDQYPRYAAVVANTNSARIFVFSRGTIASQQAVQNVKTRRSSMGGCSQARYQRHVENFHLHHMKEVAEMLDRVVRHEAINQIVVACDDVTKSLLMDQLPHHLAEKVVDFLKLDKNTPEHEILAESMDALRRKDADTDAERVNTLLGEWRAGGLGVVGPDDTLQALTMGQVEELLIATSPDRIDAANSLPEDAAPAPMAVDARGGESDPDRLQVADELVARAQRSTARIRFIEDPNLLSEVGGVGALLRFKI